MKGKRERLKEITFQRQLAWASSPHKKALLGLHCSYQQKYGWYACVCCLQEHGAAQALAGRWPCGSPVHTALHSILHSVVHAHNSRSCTHSQDEGCSSHSGMMCPLTSITVSRTSYDLFQASILGDRNSEVGTFGQTCWMLHMKIIRLAYFALKMRF